MLQLPEVWPHGQDMLEGLPDMSVLCWKPPFQPVQRGQAGHPEVRQLWRGTRHHHRACSKRLTLANKAKVAQKVDRPQAATPPTKNAWTKKFVPTMEDFPQTLTAVRAPPTLIHTVEVARPQVARPKPVATKTVVPDQRRQTSFVPRPVQRTVESQRCGVALKSTPHPSCSYNGPFQDHGGVHPVCSYNGPFQDHGCATPVCSDNASFQDHRCSQSVHSDDGPFQGHRGSQSVRSDNGPFQGHGCSHPNNGPSQDHGCSQSVHSDNGPFQGHRGSQSVSPDNGPFQGHHGCTTVNPVTNTLISSTGRANYIKLVHWNAQGAISKTSAIQTTIVQDDIDIVMIQDTRYKRRPDDLPNLRIQGYHTYHRTMDEGGHGLVTLVKHTIPSEAADQVDLGDGTETLSIRIWINNKPLLLHNLYRVNGVLDVTTTLTREPRSILAGDFNARDERWCRANNPAGRLLNEQIQDLDNFCLMNHPQVWTTVYKTAIDLSIVPADMAPSTSWSIYPGLLSDHLAVQLEIQVRTTPGRVAGLKRWRTQHADWELYREHMMASTANMEWADVETNEANITRAILEAAELAIPKSSGKTSAAPYWRNNMGIRMAKNSYNSKLKAYRRHTSQANLELMQAAYKEFYSTMYPCEEPILEPVDHRV